MKKLTILCIFFTFLILPVACSNIVTNYSSCKHTRSNTVTIEYNYSSKNKSLQITHKGAMLNCCLSNISAQYTLKNKIITIEEDEKLRDLCKCVCPYDITMKIHNISPGTYTLIIGRFSMPLDVISKPLGKKIFYR